MDAAFRNQGKLGPGLFESVCETILAYEKGRRGLRVVRQQSRLLIYLRFAGKRVGLLITFHVLLIKDGTTRAVNGLEDDPHVKSPGRKDLDRFSVPIPPYKV